MSGVCFFRGSCNTKAIYRNKELHFCTLVEWRFRWTWSSYTDNTWGWRPVRVARLFFFLIRGASARGTRDICNLHVNKLQSWVVKTGSNTPAVRLSKQYDEKRDQKKKKNYEIGFAFQVNSYHSFRFKLEVGSPVRYFYLFTKTLYVTIYSCQSVFKSIFS